MNDDQKILAQYDEAMEDIDNPTLKDAFLMGSKIGWDNWCEFTHTQDRFDEGYNFVLDDIAGLLPEMFKQYGGKMADEIIEQFKPIKEEKPEPDLNIAEAMEKSGVKLKFWACPDCPKSLIYWKGALATCRTCLKTNEPKEAENDT